MKKNRDVESVLGNQPYNLFKLIKAGKGKITVHFEDQGQDCQKWVIDNGLVVDTDLQQWMWNGTLVHNTDINPGDFLEVTFPKAVLHSRWKYKVTKVEVGNGIKKS